jgi:hypothetical protein
VQMTNPKANSLMERRNNGKGVRGIRNPLIMLVGETLKRRSQSILVIFARKTTRPISALILMEAQKFLAQQQPAVLMNPFPHGKNLTQASSSAEGGSQGPPLSSSYPSSTNMYMMKGDSYITTRALDYENVGTSEKDKEDKNPPLPLQIVKTMGETMTHIPKGAFKKYSYNPNARSTQN